MDSGKEPTTNKNETINKALESCEKLHGLYLRQEEIFREVRDDMNRELASMQYKKQKLAKQKQQLTKLKENTSAN